MSREKFLLQLLSDDLHSLHASAVALEKDLRRLSLEIESDNTDSLGALIGQINASGFAPIECMLREAGMTTPSPEGKKSSPAVGDGVLAEAAVTARRTRNRRIGTASAISVMRRAARYMELYCSSVADSATRLDLKALADHLRAWAREWIGLELSLNAVAARARSSARHREDSVFAADLSQAF